MGSFIKWNQYSEFEVKEELNIIKNSFEVLPISIE